MAAFRSPVFFFLHQRLFDTTTAQEERLQAIQSFKRGEKDVLVATDVASKGLDFPDVQHVINYDMPKDIESYGTHSHMS